MTIFLQGADDELPTPKPQACLIVDGSNLFQVSLTADFNRTDAKRLKLALEVKTGCDITQAVYVGVTSETKEQLAGGSIPAWASYYQQAGFELILFPALPEKEKSITRKNGLIGLPSSHHSQTDDSIRHQLDQAAFSPDIEVILLVSGDMDFLQPVLEAQQQGKKVFVCASQGTISAEMKEAGTFIDLIELNQNPGPGPAFFYSSKPTPAPETELEQETAGSLPSQVWSMETALPTDTTKAGQTVIINIFVTDSSVISEIISQIMTHQRGAQANESIQS